VKQIIIFSSIPIKTDLDIQVYSSLSEFYKAEIAPDDINGFWVSSSFDSKIIDLSYKLRSSDFWYHFIYSESKFSNPLIDLQITLNETVEQFQKTQILLKKLSININNLQKEEKLLLYLYLRENMEIIPLFDTSYPKLYHYPIIECLSTSKTDEDWIEVLISKELITYSRLVDRVRLCTKCNDAHLYFVDICPNCSSINIKESRILHCFTCGYVEKEGRFMTDSGLVCPKCRSSLKLIGVDYDLPAAQHSCSDCGSIFEEPKVIAKCMACHNLNNPENLNIYEVHTIQSTNMGREYLLVDQKNIVFSLFSKNLKNIKIEEFKLFLNWMISIYARKNDFAFAILLLEFSNMEKIIDFYGFTKANELLNELSHRILELLRDTDMLSMDENYNLWMLLPITSKKGIEQRLQKTIEELQQNLELHVEIHIKTLYTSNSDFSTKNDAQFLMDLVARQVVQ